MGLKPKNWESFGPKGRGPKNIAEDWENADAHSGLGHSLQQVASKLYAKEIIGIDDIAAASRTGQNGQSRQQQQYCEAD